MSELKQVIQVPKWRYARSSTSPESATLIDTMGAVHSSKRQHQKQVVKKKRKKLFLDFKRVTPVSPAPSLGVRSCFFLITFWIKTSNDGPNMSSKGSILIGFLQEVLPTNIWAIGPISYGQTWCSLGKAVFQERSSGRIPCVCFFRIEENALPKLWEVGRLPLQLLHAAEPLLPGRRTA